MNHPKEYVIFVKGGNELAPITLNNGFFHVYTDVPNGKPMYVVVKELKNVAKYSQPPKSFTYDIHIHEPGDIGAGQWENQLPGKPHRTEQIPVKPIK